MRSKVINEINSLGKSLLKKSKWKSSSRPFGYFGSEEDDDYVFEFFCYLAVLKDLKAKYNISYIPGDNSFPRKPADKINKPYFVLQNKLIPAEKFQLCTGTRIRLSTGDTCSPDISLQLGNSPVDPDSTHVILIMDAKYTIRPTKRLKFDILKIFSMNVVDLDTLMADKTTLAFDQLTDFKCNCLITNGLGSNKINYCKLKKVKQMEKFDTSLNYNIIG